MQFAAWLVLFCVPLLVLRRWGAAPAMAALVVDIELADALYRLFARITGATNGDGSRNEV